MGLRPLACWDCGFESRQGHRCLSLLSVVCCQVEVSVIGQSLIQRSPTECGASECDPETSTMGNPKPTWAFGPWEKNIYIDINRSLLQKIKCLFVPIFLFLLTSQNFLNHLLITTGCNLPISRMYKIYDHILLPIHTFKSNLNNVVW